MIVVDGVEGASLNDIDPNIIESISILKDAGATAVYGIRGTNGVVLIKTKRGKSGKTQISFNSFVSKQTPTNFPELLGSVDDMLLRNEAVANTGSPILPFDAATINAYRTQTADNMNIFNTDWKDLLFQNNGMMHNHNLQVSGGSDKVSFLVSGTYLNQQGLMVNNSFKKFDLRLNGDIQVTNKIKFSTDVFFTKSSNTQPAGMSTTEIVQRSISMARHFPGKFGNGLYGDAGQSNRINPTGAAENSGINFAETPTLSLRFALNAEIFKNFIVEASYNNRSSYTESYVARGTYDSYNPNPATNSYILAQVVGDSALSYTNNRFNSNQYFLGANYSFVFDKNHSFKIQGAIQGLDNLTKSVGASRQGLISPDRPYLNLATSALQPSVSGSATENSLIGFLGRINYAFKNTYLLEIGGRVDGSSRFSRLTGKQKEFFPSASLGWVLSNEEFIKKIPLINYAKFRASYGKLSNESVGQDYPFVAQINQGNAYYFNNTLTPGSSISSFPNEGLRWEKSYQLNFGLDMILLKNKLSVTFDVYSKKIEDLLINFPLPVYTGFPVSSTQPQNIGSMINRGWEFSATYKDKIGKLNYTITANLSDVTNEVLNTRGIDVVQGNQVSRAGHSVRSYQVFLTDGLYQVGDNVNKPYNGTRFTGPGDIKYRDIDGNDTINSRDRVLVGNNFPRYDYSLNINVDYKGFDLNVFLFGVGMRDNYISGIAVQPFNAGNWIAGGLTSALDRWTTSKTNARLPRLFSGGNGNYVSSDYWLQSGAFMRVKHITLGYTLPKKLMDKLKIQSLRFYVNTVNPFTFSNYEPGFDPEIANTSGAFYPIMKTTTVGLNLKF